MASQGNVADGLAPSHTYLPNRGYISDNNSPSQQLDDGGHQIPEDQDAEGSDDLDDIFDDSAEGAELCYTVTLSMPSYVRNIKAKLLSKSLLTIKP